MANRWLRKSRGRTAERDTQDKPVPLKPRFAEGRFVRRRPRPAGKGLNPLLTALAWGVHAYTALGLVLAAAIAVLLVEGAPGAFRWSFLLMAVATFVDATDGTLARKVKVKDVLPGFDGRKLDDITDFLTYTSLPLLLVWRAELLPAGTDWCLLIPLLASAYGFCQCAAKTDDNFFLGFPSLWNLVAFYLYVLPMNPWASLAVVLTLAFLTFVPTRYLYPSQPGKLNLVCNALALPWVALAGWLLWHLPEAGSARSGTFVAVALLSLFYPAFYMGASWVVSAKFWLKSPKRGRGRRAALEFNPAATLKAEDA